VARGLHVGRAGAPNPRAVLAILRPGVRGGGCRCGCYSGSMMGVCVLLFFLSNFECFCVGNIIEQEI
jgi:hypothetical protein